MATTYFTGLSAEQKNNIAVIIQKMKSRGITNQHTIAAILAISSKESAFIPRSESSYKTTPNDRIRAIFSAVRALNDADLSALKANDAAFFDKIYGGLYGNLPNEGYKYRGRGFNQLTFKANYKSIGTRIGIDLVNNPDLANTVPVAADILIDFFIREFDTAKKLNLLAKYNTGDINGFKNQEDALNAVFQANRGWNKTGPDTTGGYAAAQGRVDGFLQMLA